ncbi:MAG: Mur ligase domain-containing protein, partial [Bacteroidota bacterium]
MFQLDDLIEGLALNRLQKGTESLIRDIQFDSRKVDTGSLFVAIVGSQTDGHQYIQSALDQGARGIIFELLPQNIQVSDYPTVSFLKSENSAQSLGQLSANFYQHPSQEVKVVGVTGTNGKTTTATLLFR